MKLKNILTDLLALVRKSDKETEELKAELKMQNARISNIMLKLENVEKGSEYTTTLVEEIAYHLSESNPVMNKTPVVTPSATQPQVQIQQTSFKIN